MISKAEEGLDEWMKGQVVAVIKDKNVEGSPGVRSDG